MRENIKNILFVEWLNKTEEPTHHGRTTISDLVLSLFHTKKEESFQDLWGWLHDKNKITPKFASDIAFTMIRMYKEGVNKITFDKTLEQQERAVPKWKEDTLIKCLPFLNKGDHNHLFFNLFQYSYLSYNLSLALEDKSLVVEQGKNAALLVSNSLSPSSTLNSVEHSASLLRISEKILKTHQNKFKHTLRASSSARLENRDAWLEASINMAKCYKSFSLWMKYSDTDVLRVLTGALNAEYHKKHKSGKDLSRQFLRYLMSWPEEGQMWLEGYFREQGMRVNTMTESFRETGFEDGGLPLLKKTYSILAVPDDDILPWLRSFCSWAVTAFELSGVLAVSRWDGAIRGLAAANIVTHQAACLDACEKALSFLPIGLSEDQEKFLNEAREWRMRSQASPFAN